MTSKVAYITGASRGIGAESAVALARAGYAVAITARTLSDGERHDHIGKSTPLPGSLEATAAAVRAVGGEACACRRISWTRPVRWPPPMRRSGISAGSTCCSTTPSTRAPVTSHRCWR
ncbi:MAG: SDR family NAD(P)-dependent oxidoreductase [Halioglobus sp.]